MRENIIMDLKEKKTLTIHHHKRGKGEYEGELIDNKPHGYGKCIWNGEETMGGTYEGEWEAGEMQGKGKFTYRGGCDTYEGQIKDGMKWGYGKYIHTRGEIHEGEYVKKIKHGKGKLIKVSGDSYDGQWKDNLADGYGKYIHKNGDIY